MMHIRFSGPGIRSRQTSLSISERDQFLRQARDRFCIGMSHRRAAEMLHHRLVRFRDGAWRRYRSEALCPPKLAGRIEALFWCALKCRDAIPAEETIRKVIGA